MVNTLDPQNLNNFSEVSLYKKRKGHVAVALSKKKLIHAYGPMKKTLIMGILKQQLLLQTNTWVQ